MTLIYTIKEKLIPGINGKTQDITDVHNYRTRSREDFYVSMVSSNYSQNDFFHNGLIQYNNLQHDVKNSCRSSRENAFYILRKILIYS